MTREEARALLTSDAEITYLDADSIFTAFGFLTESPNYQTEVYYHPRWKRQCGAFTARDDGHTLSALQRRLIERMIDCVEFCERYS